MPRGLLPRLRHRRSRGGTVRHDPQPPPAPDPHSALLCCATPVGDVVLDV